MIDFSNVTSGGGGGDFELIPAGTIARTILTIKRGGEVLKEYSQEHSKEHSRSYERTFE